MSCVSLCSSYPDHTIKISVRELGREDLLEAVARRFQERILVNQDKFKVLELLQYSDAFTNDPSQARIHAVPMSQVYFLEFYCHESDQKLKIPDNSKLGSSIITYIFIGTNTRLEGLMSNLTLGVIHYYLYFHRHKNWVRGFMSNLSLWNFAQDVLPKSTILKVFSHEKRNSLPKRVHFIYLEVLIIDNLSWNIGWHLMLTLSF